MEEREHISDEARDLAAMVVQAILEDPKLTESLCERLAVLGKQKCSTKKHTCTSPFTCTRPFDCNNLHEVVVKSAY